MVKGRDSKGHFIKGNVPWNKKVDSSGGGLNFICQFCHKQKPLEEMKTLTRFFPPLIVCKACWKLLE